ncbi:MAG: Lrp/AsnC family transcriptional regulator [Dehalococcoidia bacterium]|nr:Lrp/AsnC family transcriptional regulator [Dehalococcoidia bacterium]
MLEEEEIRMKTMSASTELGDLEQMLARELTADARQSTRDLSAKLSTNPTTVASRLRKMVAAKVIDFVTLVDPWYLGFHLKAILGLKAQTGKALEAARELEGCENIQTVTLTTGRYDIVTTALFKDDQNLLVWMSNRLSRVRQIATVEVMTVLQEVKYYHIGLLGDASGRREARLRCLDESDMAMIRELELNPRVNIGVLGKRIGVSRQTATRRLQRLLGEKVVRVIAVANPSVLGLTGPVFVFMKVKLELIFVVSDALAADWRVMHVAVITGSFNLVAYMAFPSDDDMYHFLTNDLGNIPGVVDHETMTQVGKSHGSFRLASQ